MIITRKIEKNKLSVKLYYLAYFIYVIYSTFSVSMLAYNRSWVPVLGKIVTWSVFVLLCIRILFTNQYKFYQLVIAIAALTAAITVYLVVDDSYPLFLILFIFASKGCSDKTISKIYIYCNSFLLLIFAVLSQYGYTKDRIFYKDGFLTHSMGLTYPNDWATFIFFITVVIIYVNYNRLPRYTFVIILGIATIVYLITRCRLEVYSLILFAICLIPPILRCILKSRIFRFIARTSFLWSLIISFGLTFLYMSDTSRFAGLNRLFSTRLSLSALGIVKYGLSPWGIVFRQQGWGAVDFDNSFGYFFIDSFYISYTLKYGVIFMIILTIIFTIAFFGLRSENNWLLLFIFFSSFHGIIIWMITQPYFCPFFVIAYAKYTSKEKSYMGGNDPFKENKYHIKL